MKRALVFILFAALSAQPALAADAGILAKVGGDFDTRTRDQGRCHGIAAEAHSDELPGMAPIAMASGAQGGAYAVAGAAIVDLIFLAVQTDRARGRAEAFCLNNLGYGVVPLTGEEFGAYGGLAGAKREAFERAFMARDLSSRLVPLLTPKVPPLPAYVAEPAVQGGLRIDLPSLKAANQPVSPGGVVVTGEMVRWRTAVLVKPFKSATGRVMVAADPGVVFHQVDYRTQRASLLRTQGATWCGPVIQTTATPSGLASPDGAREVYCFTSQAEGYDVFRPSGFDWLAGPYRTGFVLAQLKEPILLKERPQDDLGTLKLQILASEIKVGRITLEGKAVRNGRVVDLWRRRLDFDAQGEAVLPLWNRRLVIARLREGTVTAVIDDRGDGHGWREGD